MGDSLQDTLTKRLAQACRRSFDPCPLIGPKWLKACTANEPGDFRYTGLPKLAKAMGFSMTKTAERLMKNLSLRGLDVRAELTDDGYIDFYGTGSSKGGS